MDDKNRKALIDAFAADEAERSTLVDDIMALVHELEKASPELADQFIDELVPKDWSPEKNKH